MKRAFGADHIAETMRAAILSTLAILAGVTGACATDITGIPRIVDGDTVEIGSVKIRLEGIDTPETDQLCLDAHGKRWTCGIEARDQLVKHAGGKSWTCSVSSQDRYGRSLAHCKAGGEDIEKWMVHNGWAMSFVRYSLDLPRESGEPF